AFDLWVGEAIDEYRPAHRGFTAASGDLLAQPLKVLDGLSAEGQGIDRVLDGDRADPLEPTPDLDAEVVWFGRKLVDEEEPTGGAFLHSHRLLREEPMGAPHGATSAPPPSAPVIGLKKCRSATAAVTAAISGSLKHWRARVSGSSGMASVKRVTASVNRSAARSRGENSE